MSRALGTAVGNYLATLDKRVLVVGSGGLSHDPPVPTLATAPPAALDRIVHGEPMTSEQRQARQAAVMEAAHELRRTARATLQPLNPEWDHASWKSIDTGRLADIDAWSNIWIAARRRRLRARSPHLGGGFRRAGGAGPVPDRACATTEPAPELIAGFAIRTAVPA